MARTRYAALLTCAALFASPATAVAGPDDGKHVATQTHIDSPKAFWENDSLTLKTHQPDTDSDLADTVAWVGKGWGNNDTPQYQFTVPEDPALSFAGTTGKTYYSAPATVNGNQNPIWIGFGADTELPVDSFRDNIASLDLLSVDGPGEVEMFGYFPGPGGLQRFFGTSEGAPRSAWLTSGTHTHNYTVFSKPGRYRLTYRTTARDKDGMLITSAPTTTSIQVGGQRPADNATPTLQERFDAAPSGDPSAENYQLSIAPKQKVDKPGDEHLSTIDFTGGSDGTLTLLIDGYFLTDLPVKDGKAHWEELLGPEASSLQAVYTPAGAKPRWVSEKLSYTEGATLRTTSQKSEDSWTDTENTRQLQSEDEVTVSDTGLVARAEPAGEGATRIVVEAADKKFNGFVHGGFFSPGSKLPDIDFDGVMTNGRADFVVGADDIYNGNTIRLDILPHPTVTTAGTSLTLSDDFAYGTTYKAHGELGTTDPAPAESPETPAETEKPAPPSTPGTGRCTDKVVLDHGHVDIAATRDGDSFTARLKDETAIVDKQAVERPLDDVVLAVHDNARRPRPQALAGKEFDYLGSDKFYLLPQTQQQGIIWPGYNTQSLKYSDFKDGRVDLTIEPTSMPDGGNVGMFLTEGVGNSFTPLLNTAEGDTTVETTFASHTHANWAFTKPGIYELTVTYSATTRDGKDITSQPQTLTVAVGDAAIESCVSGKGGSESEQPSAPHEPNNPSREDSSSERVSKGLWSLVLPVVLAVIFQAFLNFFNDNCAQIESRLSGLLPH